MRITTTIFLASVGVLLTSLFPDHVSAKCCRSDAGGDCGDNSPGTPCCGYNKCNAFCCACRGVYKGRQLIESKFPDGTAELHTVTEITADCGVTWTCRDDHITKHPPRTQCTSSYAIPPPMPRRGLRGIPVEQVMPTITPSPILEMRASFDLIEDKQVERDLSADAIETHNLFMEVAEGAENITLDQYLGYFGYSANFSVGNRKDAVIAKFHLHDEDNDGLLTIDEINKKCTPGEGCD